MNFNLKTKRQKYKILQITNCRFPPEIRVLKEGLSLQQAGYETAVLCPPYEGQLEYESWHEIDIYRPRVLGNRSLFDKLKQYILLYSSAWHEALESTIAKFNPDVLHFHDIWLGKSVISVLKDEHLVVDLHENMPAAVVEYAKGNYGMRKCFAKLFQNYHRIRKLEQNLLAKSDLVLVVVEEARDRIVDNYSEVNAKKIINVENLEKLSFGSIGTSGNPSFGKDHFSVLYIGGFGAHRGVDTLIRAVAKLKSNRLNIKLQLIGAQPSQYLDMLSMLISELDVENLVQITQWVSASDVLANIQQADVCTVPHHSNPHTDTTIPHKLFQYMVAKRPVLVSSSKPLARTVMQARAGMIFEAGDYDDCAEKISILAQNPDKCREYARNGYDYVTSKGHNWEEMSAPKLIYAYDCLLGVQ